MQNVGNTRNKTCNDTMNDNCVQESHGPRATALNDDESLVPFCNTHVLNGTTFCTNSTIKIVPMKIFLSKQSSVPFSGTRVRAGRCHSNNSKILNDTDIDSFYS